MIPTDILVAARACVHSYEDKELVTVERIAGVWYITIDGTRTMDDWFSNLRGALMEQTLLVGDGGVRLHSGFSHTSSHVIGTIDDWMEMNEFSGETIVICGHSRGGAVALIVAARLCEDARFTDATFQVVTFGSPRAGRGAWKRHYKRLCIDTVRVEVDFDPVVHAIPWFHADHVGKRVHLDDNGRVIGRIRGGWATFRRWMGWDFGERRDHNVVRYAQTVEKWVLTKIIVDHAKEESWL